MSLCLAMLTKDVIFMSGDTRVSCNHNGTIYATGEQVEKIKQVDNKVIFMSGSAEVISHIMSDYESSKNRSIERLQQLTIQYKEESIAQRGNDWFGKTAHAMFLIGCIESGIPVIYGINSKDDCKIIRQVGSRQLMSATIGPEAHTPKARKIYDECRSKRLDVVETYKRVYDGVSCEEIGGKLCLYTITTNGINKDIFNIKDRGEVKTLRLKDRHYNADEMAFYVEDEPVLWFDIQRRNFMFSGHLEAATGTFHGRLEAGEIDSSEIWGSIIRGSEFYGGTFATRETGYPRIVMSETSDLLYAEYSVNRKITIDPNNYLTNQYPHLRWESDGYEAHIHHAGEAGLQIEADTVVVNADLDVQSGGKFWAPSLSHYTFGSNPRSLQSELNDYVLQLEYDMKIASLEARIRALEDA